MQLCDSDTPVEKYANCLLAGRSKLPIVRLNGQNYHIMTTIMLLMRMKITLEQTVAVHNYVFAMRNSGGDATIAA